MVQWLYQLSDKSIGFFLSLNVGKLGGREGEDDTGTSHWLKHSQQGSTIVATKRSAEFLIMLDYVYF